MAGDDDEVTPPGWYRQPDDPTTLRWWDGDDWTDDTMPVPTAGGGRGSRAGAAPPASGSSGSRRTRADRMAEEESGGSRGREGGAGSPARRRSAAADERADGAPAVEILVDPGDEPAGDGLPPRRRRSPQPGAGPGYVRTQPATVRLLDDEDGASGSAGRADRRRTEPSGSERRGAERRPATPRTPDGPRLGSGRPADPRPGGAGVRPTGSSADGARRGPAAGRRPTIDQDRPGSRAGAGRLHSPEPAERTAPPLLKVLLRAALIAVLLGIGWFGYVRLRDAGPSSADTLSDDPQPIAVDGDSPGLEEIVLTLADLPPGWSAQAADLANDDICNGRIPRSVLEPTALQSAAFTLGDTGALIGNTVEEFVNTDVAESFMDLTADVLDSCREYGADGSQIALVPYDFPAFGDETFVARLEGTAPGGPLRGAVVYVRDGNRVASVVSIAFGEAEVNKELVEHLTRLVARRMEGSGSAGAPLPGA